MVEEKPILARERLNGIEKTLARNCPMRGDDLQQTAMFSYISPEQRVPTDHPLRPIRQMVDDVLKSMSRRFAKLYSHTGRQVLIPAGARVLGETKPVQAFGETRLAVSFHRLLMPDGRTYRLDQFLGLNQIGDAGLRDKVNHHYLSTFGAAAAVGLISGLSQYLGSAGLGSGDGNRTIVIAGGVGDATAQAAMQVMNRFLNRLPTITIREGHRVKVYLTSDLELPAYVAPGAPN
jgi:hypothetical protein